MKLFLILLLTAPLCACAASKSIKSLAQSTGPLVAETQSTASMVQKRFIEQNTVVDGRVARWNEYAAASRSLTETPVALWTIDSQTGSANASSAKAKLLMLERVRAADTTANHPATATAPPEAAPISVSSAKLIILLDGIAKGKLMTVEAAGAWVQATNKALADLKKDAEPAQEK